MEIMLAAISGQTVVHALITLIIVGVVFWLILWLIGYVGLPEPFAKVAKVVLAIVAVIFLINFLLSLSGNPIITWP